MKNNEKIKSLMICIHEKHAENIMNGNKNAELRTWCPKNFKGWIYVCVPSTNVVDSSKVLFKFYFSGENYSFSYRKFIFGYGRILKASRLRACLSKEEITMYARGNQIIYIWPIRRIEIFEHPMELKEFTLISSGKPLSRGPQKMAWILPPSNAERKEIYGTYSR